MLGKIDNLNELETLKLIIDTIDALIYVIDIETYEILYANEQCVGEFGNIINQKCFNVLQKDKDGPCEKCPLYTHDFITQINGTLKWEHTNSINKKTYLFSNKTIHINNKLLNIQVGIDITKEKALEKEVEEQYIKNIEALNKLSNSTIEGLLILDEEKRCYQVNDVAPKLLGYTNEEMIGKSALEFIADESKDIVREFIKNSDQKPYEAFIKRKDGSTFPALLRGKDIKLHNKNFRISAVLDITELKEKEKLISKMAYYDNLTSLPNRVLLKDRLNQLILKKERTGEFGALMFIDLDHFKTINDTKGHIIGDKILIDCARRLETITRAYDTVARFGGDEFIIIIDANQTNKDNAIKIFSDIAKKILETIKRPFFVDEHQFQLSASIGISIFNNKVTYSDLLKKAGSAMYYSKYNGKDNFSFFDPELQKDIERKSLILEKLREAINNKKIKIHYQKQVDQNQNVVGVEALARWYDEELGFISPVEFIPIAEDSGLIIPFGNYLIEEVCGLINLWKEDEEKKDWRVSINISLHQFERDDFIETVSNLINKYNTPKNKLRIEITESLLLKNADKALETINSLKKLGISISIDDFGTGYSSLSYLKKLPINELKIDKSFIDEILTDDNDETIVMAIISIGKKFGFELIAEGVETKEVYEKLKDLGCEFLQGYYFAKPVSKDEL